MEFLFSVADRLFNVPLAERIRVEGIEDSETLAFKNGTLVSVIRLGGSRGMSGRRELCADVEAVRVSLSPFLSSPGHAIEFTFSRDPGPALQKLASLIGNVRTRAEELGMDADGILTERQRRLGSLLVEETSLVVVHTLPSEQLSREMVPTKASGNEDQARHSTLTDALCRSFCARNISACVLDATDALRELRASIHPLAAPWRERWSPSTCLDPAGSGEGRACLVREWPGLDHQLATGEAEILDQQIVRIGDALISGLDVTVGPEILKPFNELVEALAAAPETFPWRCSFLVEPCGLRSVWLKEQYSKLFAFAAPIRNGRIRDAIAWLREIDGSEDAVIRLRMSFATWTSVGEESRLRRNAAALGRAVEQWGNLSVDGVSGDPLATALSTAVSFGPDSTAPPAAAPLSHALSLMPIGRPASPWASGPVLFRTDDGRMWPYLPGSSSQNSWVEIFSGSSGSGKSVAMNSMNLAVALAGYPVECGTTELPRMAIVDIGHSSKGLIDLLTDLLPRDRLHEVAHLKLKMTPDHAINPFDTPPGMRAPYAAGRSFMVNLLSVMAGASQEDSVGPMTGLMGAVVDQAYRQMSDEGQPKRLVADEEPGIDETLEQIGVELGEFGTWWEAADALFVHGRFKEAARAQARAVPVIADLIDASHADQIVGLYRDVRVTEGGEPVLQALRRVVSEAVRDVPVLAGATRFDPGYARIVALDLDEVVAAQVAGDSRRQASMMFMLARQILIRDWLLDADEVSRATEEGILPAVYRDYHFRLATSGRLTPKLFAMDEYHRSGGLPGFRRQVLQDAREGRKNNIRIALSSQAVDDFGDDILEAATSVFIFDAPSNRSVERLAGEFGLGGFERSILRDQLTGPGRNGAPLFAIIRHKAGTSRQKINLTLGAAELWALSTTPEDVALRECIYRKFGVSEALLLLASRFPGGSAKAEIEKAVARSRRTERSERVGRLRAGAIESLAEQLAGSFHEKLDSRAGTLGSRHA